MAADPLYEDGTPDLEGIAADVVDAVSREEPWGLVEEFADLERVSGTADERRGADYVCDRLDWLEIPYDRHEPELHLSVPRDASLTVTDPDDAGPLDASLVPDPEDVDGDFDVSVEAPAVKTVAFSGTGTVSGELAVGPRTADGDGGDGDADDLLAGSALPDAVAGRVVVIEGLLPIERIREADERGASAVVVVHPHPREPHEGIATPVWGGAPDPDGERGSPSLPVLTVARPVGERLYELAAADRPVFVEATADVETGWESCPLVVADVEADGGTDDGFVLLHGHYDSWHAGVGDNATGDAVLLELARVFDEHAGALRRDLKVAWWPGHSTGRYAGSTWFVDEHAIQLDERCVAHVNVDSPGTDGATAFEDAVWMPEAGPLCRDAVADVCGKEAAGGRPPRAGDYSFSNLGVTGLFMLSSSVPDEERRRRGWHPVGGCGGNADAWHLTTDTLDVADPDVLVRDAQVYAAAVARLCAAPVVPLDYRATVEQVRETVSGYDEAAGEAFDLAPVVTALDDLEDALDGLYDAVGGPSSGSAPGSGTGDDGSAVAPATANDALRACSRALVRTGFVTEGRFEQDPAVERPPVPALAPAADLSGVTERRRRHRLPAVRRARNRVVAELRAARRAVADATPDAE